MEITYLAASSDRARVLGMRCSETYNGDTDTRLFLYGDGSNTCIYSGVTQGGAPSAAYFPAMNEIRVDGADAPITGFCATGEASWPSSRTGPGPLPTAPSPCRTEPSPPGFTCGRSTKAWGTTPWVRWPWWRTAPGP